MKKQVGAGSYTTPRDTTDPIAAGTPVAGGFIKLAIVSRDLHRIWIPHRWEEDRVGATLDPDPAERLPEQFCAVHPSVAAGKRR